MQIDLWSGVFGAAVIAVLTLARNRYSRARELDNVRVLVYEQMQKTFKPLLTRYIADCEKVKERVTEKRLHYPEDKEGFEMMPMLNGDVIRSIPRNTLFEACCDVSTFMLLSDLSYVVDFLKDHMPLKASSEFSAKLNAHLEEKGFTTLPQKYDHIDNQHCGTAEGLKQQYLAKLSLNVQSAQAALKSVEEICNELKGTSDEWRSRYFIQ